MPDGRVCSFMSRLPPPREGSIRAGAASPGLIGETMPWEASGLLCPLWIHARPDERRRTPLVFNSSTSIARGPPVGAAKGVKIIFVLWTRHVGYDEQHHLATMARQHLRQAT